MIGGNLTRYYEGDFLVVDTEGEGLNLNSARPWQVAWAIASLKDGIKSTHVTYPFWPDLRVSREAALKTRFDLEYYKKMASPASSALDLFHQSLYNPTYRVIAQNALGYDVYVHKNWCQGVGKQPDWIERSLEHSYLSRLIDTNAILKARKKGWKPDLSSPENFLSWQYRAIGHVEKGLKTNLEYTGKELKIDHDFGSLHDAKSDIELTFKIFKKIVYEVDF